jgi:hypothetical protein
MTPAQYRKIEDALCALCILSTPQENVIVHAAKVQNLCSQLFAGPAPSLDLAYLAAKTKTTDERFKLNVMMRMSIEEEAMNPKNYVSVCVDFIRLYNSRPTDDWGPNQKPPIGS